MSIEMHEPQIKALIQQRMATEAFHNMEEVLLYALKSAPPTDAPAQRQIHPTESLEETFAKARGLSTDEEVNLLFNRENSTAWRPLDLP